MRPSTLHWPPHLHTVDLSFSRIEDDELKEILSHLPATVRSLGLRATAVNDGHLEMIARNPVGKELEELDIGFSAVTSRGVQSLSSLTSLTKLACTVTMVDDMALPTFAKLATLRELDLDGTRITAAGLLAQRGFLLNLRKLDLSGMQSVNDDTLQLLLQSAPNLVELKVSKTAVTNASFKELLSLPELKEIELIETNVRVDKLEDVGPLPNFQWVTIHVARSQVADRVAEGTWSTTVVTMVGAFGFSSLMGWSTTFGRKALTSGTMFIQSRSDGSVQRFFRASCTAQCALMV